MIATMLIQEEKIRTQEERIKRLNVSHRLLELDYMALEHERDNLLSIISQYEEAFLAMEKEDSMLRIEIDCLENEVKEREDDIRGLEYKVIGLELEQGKEQQAREYTESLLQDAADTIHSQNYDIDVLKAERDEAIEDIKWFRHQARLQHQIDKGERKKARNSQK